MDRQYVDAVRLLLAVAPMIFESPRFALKGGTALNLFVQDLPRLSVDIDVVFTDHAMAREPALIAIGDDLQAAKAKLERMGYSATIRKTQKGDEAKLLVADQASQIKVEVNFVFRGTLLPVVPRTLVSSARKSVHHRDGVAGPCHSRTVRQQTGCRAGSPASARLV